MNATIYHFQQPFAEDVTDGSPSDFPFTGIPSTITVSSNYGSRYYCVPPEVSERYNTPSLFKNVLLTPAIYDQTLGI